MSNFENPGQNLIALTPETADTGEIFNLHEDGEVARGQLRRFYKIFGAKLDEAKGLVDAFPTMIDVDTTDSDFLPMIGELVGVAFNREIPIPQAREEIKQAVPWYKRKGTLIGCRIHGYKISRLQTDIVEFWRNIKTTVTIDSVPGNIRSAYSAVGVGNPPLMGLPGDKTAYAYDYAAKDVLVIGEQFASSETVGHEAWRAVDDSEASTWVAASAAPAYWGFSKTDAILPLRFRIKAGLGLERFRLQWADDVGGPWTDAGEYVFGDVRNVVQNPGVATGAAQTMVLTRTPVSPLPEPEVYEVTGYAGADTTITAALEEGDTVFYVEDTGGLAVDDWVELFQLSMGYDYFQIKRIEGNLVTMRTPVARASGWPALTPLRKVNVTLKTLTTDYTIDTLGGLVYLIAGQFTVDNKVFVDFTALYDRYSISIWREFTVDTDNLIAHKCWRLYVDSSWIGNPEIAEVEFLPDQFYGTFYRGERLGYYFTLGNMRPGCDGRLMCNAPLLRETVEKLCRTMREAVPICTTPVMVALDCHYPEIVFADRYIADPMSDDMTSKTRDIFGGFKAVREVSKDTELDRKVISTYNPTPWIVNPATQFADTGTYPKIAPDGVLWISAWIHP